jgi:hypothetical protein
MGLFSSMKSNTCIKEEKMAIPILKKHTIPVIVVFLMFSFCGECLAVLREPIVRSDAEYPATPEKVVEEYVRKDAEGARLSGVKVLRPKKAYQMDYYPGPFSDAEIEPVRLACASAGELQRDNENDCHFSPGMGM